MIISELSVSTAVQYSTVHVLQCSSAAVQQYSAAVQCSALLGHLFWLAVSCGFRRSSSENGCGYGIIIIIIIIIELVLVVLVEGY